MSNLDELGDLVNDDVLTVPALRSRGCFLRSHGHALNLRVLRSLAIPLVVFLGAGAATASTEAEQTVPAPPLVVLELEVAVALAEPPVEPVPAVLHLERLGSVGTFDRGGSAEVDDDSMKEQVAVQAPGTARVEVAGGAVWRLSLEAPGLWAPPTIWSSAAGGRAELRAVPTGDLTGSIGPPPGGEHPEELTARFQAAGGEATESPERHTVDCRIIDGGGESADDAGGIAPFTCALPSGRFDVRLRAPGFVSHYFWNLEVPPGGEVGLGRQRLVAGASVVAWVRS